MIKTINMFMFMKLRKLSLHLWHIIWKCVFSIRYISYDRHFKRRFVLKIHKIQNIFRQSFQEWSWEIIERQKNCQKFIIHRKVGDEFPIHRTFINEFRWKWNAVWLHYTHLFTVYRFGNIGFWIQRDKKQNKKTRRSKSNHNLVNVNAKQHYNIQAWIMCKSCDAIQCYRCIYKTIIQNW